MLRFNFIIDVQIPVPLFSGYSDVQFVSRTGREPSKLKPWMIHVFL